MALKSKKLGDSRHLPSTAFVCVVASHGESDAGARGALRLHWWSQVCMPRQPALVLACSIFSWLQGDHPVHQAGRRSKVLVLTRTLSCLNSALRTSFVLGMMLRFSLQCANYSDLSQSRRRRFWLSFRVSARRYDELEEKTAFAKFVSNANLESST